MTGNTTDFVGNNSCMFTYRDRFGGSALDDAVRHGHTHIQVQHALSKLRSKTKSCHSIRFGQRLLRSKGASLDVMSSALKMCDFAARSLILF